MPHNPCLEIKLQHGTGPKGRVTMGRDQVKECLFGDIPLAAATNPSPAFGDFACCKIQNVSYYLVCLFILFYCLSFRP